MRLHAMLLCAALSVPAFAQCPSFQTLTTAGNGQNGTMFDIVNLSAAPRTILSFDQCFFNGTSDNIEIYTKTGTSSGFELNSAAWTLVGSATAVAHGVAPALDPLPIAVNVTIPAGATQAFYVTTTGGTVAYTTGAAQLGTVIGTDGILEVRAGAGMVYPFAGTFGLPTAGRLWNGQVTHCGSGTIATNTTLGQGCERKFNSVYQLFGNATAAGPALTGNALQLVPTGTGYVATWIPGAASALYVPPVAATQLLTGDDGVANYTTIAAPFPSLTGPQPTLQVSGNAIIAYGATAIDYPGTQSYQPTSNGFLNSTLGGFYAWHDYNQAEAGSGQIKAEEIGSVLYITFDGVESYASPEVLNPSTLQFQLDLTSGVVTMVFLNIDSNATSTFGSAHLIGWTTPGASAEPGSTNFATAGVIVTQDPEVLPLRLSASTRPVLGTNWNFNVTNVPATGVFGIDILGLTDPGFNDLFFLGLPGCGLRASLDVSGAWLVTGATHPWSVPLPAPTPPALGLHFYATSAVFQVPPVNAFGAITANGIDGLLGDV